jgi:hypothetical protein
MAFKQERVRMAYPTIKNAPGEERKREEKNKIRNYSAAAPGRLRGALSAFLLFQAAAPKQSGLIRAARTLSG